MSISYPLDLPSGRHGDIARVTLTARNVVGMTDSALDLTQQVTKHQGEAWQITVELNNPLDRDSAEVWIAWLTSLNGRYGYFRMGDPGSTVPRGAAGGTPRVASGSESGAVLNTYGWTSSATAILKAGDYVQLGDRMYKNLANLDTTSGGVGQLDLWPRIRTTPTSGESLVVGSCTTLFRLVENPSWEINAPGLYAINFTAVEKLP